MAATWSTLGGVPQHGTTMGAATAFVVCSVFPEEVFGVPVGRSSIVRNPLGGFSNHYSDHTACQNR